MKVVVAYNKPVPAPVKKGQEVGKVVVTAPDVAQVEAPLIAAASVDRMGPLGRMAMVAAHLIWGNRH
jgi:D-alanyl-D-alanine carboxypeptidase (penicillin-binding protein 5/6)